MRGELRLEEFGDREDDGCQDEEAGEEEFPREDGSPARDGRGCGGFCLGRGGDGGGGGGGELLSSFEVGIFDFR